MYHKLLIIIAILLPSKSKLDEVLFGQPLVNKSPHSTIVECGDLLSCSDVHGFWLPYSQVPIKPVGPNKQVG